MLPEEIKYTEEHEWVALEDDIATVGVTEYASDELGEIVFVELPDVGEEFSQMDELGSIESVKTVSSIFSPISGKVEEVNDILENNPSTVNEAPYGDGWLFKLKVDSDQEFSDLMTFEEYKTYLETL